MKRWVASVTIALVLVCAHASPGNADTLAGRLITFKQTFDGWWDVACDTAPDGSDARCYVQYVDPFSFAPNFRAAMVDFVYRGGPDGSAEPVITFDVEPDLSFARDVELAIVGTGGSEKPISVASCKTGKCVFAGTAARAMLVRWSGAKSLKLRIKEHDGKVVVRTWPLGNMREIVRTIAKQRKARGLP